MPIYVITTEVTRCSGWQKHEIEADSENEALIKFEQGDGELVDQEIRVQDYELDTIKLEEE